MNLREVYVIFGAECRWPAPDVHSSRCVRCIKSGL
jgi:hypothetical protein